MDLWQRRQGIFQRNEIARRSRAAGNARSNALNVLDLAQEVGKGRAQQIIAEKLVGGLQAQRDLCRIDERLLDPAPQ